MSDPTFLVTGATGATGTPTVRHLREAGCAVRAIVHREDERSVVLEELGAEVVVGDLLDVKSVEAVLDGVARAYFVYPISPGLLFATAAFAQAARKAGVEAVVNMSMMPARPDAPGYAAREHWLAEQIFDWSGIGVTHLRPTMFADWFLYPGVVDAIANQGKLIVPFSSGRNASVAGEDQARVIAAILTDPEPHRGQTYELYGAVEGTYAEHAEAIGRALGRTVEYDPMPIEAFQAGVKALINEHRAQFAGALKVDHANGIFAGTNDVIEQITGQPPMSVEEFAERNADRFTPKVSA